jgi:hypothetical protein
MHTAKQYEKVESSEYFVKHSDIVKIDYYYYLKALATPLDQVLNVAFPELNNLVMKQYNYMWKLRYKLLDELRNLFMPSIKFN